MNYGLIGCGGIGWLRAQALNQSEKDHLLTVHDLDESRAFALASRYGCSVESSWADLIARDDVEAVIVSTPPSLHAEMTISALNAGKHVLCEKPLARTPQECHQMLDAADKSGMFLATGFNYRFYPSILKARELFDAGLIGALDHIRSYSGYTAADHNHDWLHDDAVMGGGALRDNGIHLIDLTTYFLGKVEKVDGMASNSVWGFQGCEDNGFILMCNPNGNVATLQASWTEWQGYKFLIEIYGSRGCIRTSCFPMITQLVRFDALGAKSQRQSYYFPKTFVMEHLRSYRWVVIQSFIKEFCAFALAVQGKASAIATGQDGLSSIEIACSAACAPMGERMKVSS
jgi:predicted dehydrogenase